MSGLSKLRDLNQSVWIDYLSRDYLESGNFEKHLQQGISGVTSNPTILSGAIEHSESYDDQIARLVREGRDCQDIYEALIKHDVSVAASLMHFLYASSDGREGYISLEVDPAFANRIEPTIYQAAHLHNLIDCPNLMIKIPATDAGIEAFRQVIFEGINVNMTLLFSVEQYEKVALAYVKALSDRLVDGRRIDKAASVASFFISRIDVASNKHFLDSSCPLRNKAGIANACLAYEKWREIFHGPDFVKLRKKGAKPQRLLWASTGTKYAQDDPLLYVSNLVAADTIITLPPKTLNATIKCEDSFSDRLARYASFDAQGVIDDLARQHIYMDELSEQLLDDGIVAFMESYDYLMSCIHRRVKGEKHVRQDSES